MKDYKDDDLLDQIADSYRNKRLVLFIGSGVSVNVGASNWDQFADKMLEQLIGQVKDIDYGILKQLKQLDIKRRLSLAKNIYENNKSIGCSLSVKDAIEPTNVSDKDKEIYKILESIKACYVTTNFDTYLHMYNKNPLSESNPDKAERNIIEQVDSRTIEYIKPGNVIHLHGTYKNNEEDLIYTIDQYLERYNKDEQSDMSQFLEHLFGGDYTVVFIGYGLTEVEILQYIFLNNKNIKNKCYWLVGMYKNEDKMYGLIDKYYMHKFGIEVVQYYLDEKSYGQLNHVLNKWSEIVKKAEPKTSEIKFINSVLGK